MLLFESLQIGIRELRQHKLRSVLTMLGVIFGVAAVISTAAISAGARAELDRQLSELGANTIRVRAVQLRGAEAQNATRLSPYGLTRADAQALALGVPDVVDVSLIKRIDTTLAAEGRTVSADVIATDAALAEIVGYSVDDGRFLAETDLDQAAQVAVIGDGVRRQVFPVTNPIGQRILIGGRAFTVVGVLAPRSRSQGAVLETIAIDRAVLIPISAAMRRIATANPRAERLDEVIAKLGAGADLRESAHLAERIVLRRHNNVADFQVVVPEELIRQQQKTKDVLGQVLLFIAAISLLVGGIGIMNIMLASVTQRTREIGIRRALGASQRDVLEQFLTESLVVSVVGGVLGILTGVGLAQAIALYANWTTIVPLEAVVISVGVSAAVGFIFGLYPSMQAARLDPIEALRAE